MTPEDYDAHEDQIEFSVERRDQTREDYPEHYDKAYGLLSGWLRHFDYSKYQIFKYQAYDPDSHWINIDSALDMTAHFLHAQDQGAPYTDEYIKSFALNYVGCLPFVVLPGGKDND